MKRWIGAAVVLLAGCAAAEETVMATAPATLRIGDTGCEIKPKLFAPEWKGMEAAGGHDRKEGDRDFSFHFDVENQGRLNGKAVFAQAAGGALDAAYTFTPEKDLRLNSLYVGFALQVGEYVGGGWQLDDQKGAFPEERGGLALVSRKGRKLTLTDRTGKRQMTFAFTEPTSVMIQDDRQWGPTFSVRFHAGGQTFAAGAPVTLRYALSMLQGVALEVDAPVTIVAGKDWIPLKPGRDIAAGSALDFSKMGFHDAPAGKHGWVLSKGPHFEFERKPGVAQRFYGVNVCFTANFLEQAEAAKFAAQLARTGYNALRLHHHDGGLVEGSKDGTTVNPAQLAKLDSLMAACITNGIYVTTDLFVSRRVPWRSVGVDRDGHIAMNEFKVLVAVHDGAWDNLKRFTRQWMDHVNPYTGRRYADEPALAWLALTNEGNFGNFLNEMRGIPEWEEAWRKWLAERRQREPDAYKDIPCTIPGSIYTQNRHTTAFVLFLQEMEVRMTQRMTAFLRDEMKCRALITNMSCWTNHAVDQMTRHTVYDFVDDHFYVDHPHFLETPWRLPSSCGNRNPIRNDALGAQRVVFTRLFDKPFTITEYNYSGPGRFRGVGGIVTGSMGALQDWAGIWRFSYAHNRDTVVSPNGGAMGYFDMGSDPLSLAAERATLCLFLRGDLAPLKRSYAMLIPQGEVTKMRDVMPRNSTDWPWLGWYAQLGTVVAEKAPRGVTWSSAFPDVYNLKTADIRKLVAPAADAAQPPPNPGDGAVVLDRQSGTFVLKTARTSGGFTEKGRVDAGALVFDVGDTAATVWVSALDNQPIRRSSRLLLTHLTDVQNTNIRYAQKARQTLLAWGSLPHLARNGQAQIRLALDAPGAYSVYALAASGQRVAKIPARVGGGALVFTAAVDGQPEGATLLYEIVRE